MELFGSLFVIIPVLIGLGFLLFFGLIVSVIVRGVAQRSYNNAQPVETLPATVVAKRTSTSGGDSMVSTSYHVTFETPDGERREMTVGGTEFGLLVEGDRGSLTHQGTRYQGFQRRRV